MRSFVTHLWVATVPPFLGLHHPRAGLNGGHHRRATTSHWRRHKLSNRYRMGAFHHPREHHLHDVVRVMFIVGPSTRIASTFPNSLSCIWFCHLSLQKRLGMPMIRIFNKLLVWFGMQAANINVYDTHRIPRHSGGSCHRRSRNRLRLGHGHNWLCLSTMISLLSVGFARNEKKNGQKEGMGK